MNELDNIAIPILKNVLKEAQSIWHAPDSKYKEYRSLQIDKRGSFGERFFAQVISQIYYRRISIEYNDGDQGDWDLKFNGKKFEIKTSSLDVNGKFQNEGLKEHGDYYGILFLGVTPNHLCVKFIKKEDIDFSLLHSRENAKTGRGHKWDFKHHEMVEISKLSEFQTEFEKYFLEVVK